MATKQVKEAAAPEPTLVSIIKARGRDVKDVTVRHFFENQENLRENMRAAAHQFLKGLPESERDLVVRSLMDDELALELNQVLITDFVK